eukprot:1278510-Pleurochrysis_carterae.AAC.1
MKASTLEPLLPQKAATSSSRRPCASSRSRSHALVRGLQPACDVSASAKAHPVARFQAEGQHRKTQKAACVR